MFYNLDSEKLSNMALEEGATRLKSGAIVITTGQHTGRSPQAKRYELDQETAEKIDWNHNSCILPSEFDLYLEKFIEHKKTGKLLPVQHAQAVRDPSRRLNIAIYTEYAVHALFVRNMFLPAENIDNDEPWPADFVLYHFPSLLKEPTVLISLTRKLILISGTLYSGEIKKSIFSVLNYLSPERMELPMHCSANIDSEGNDPAIFFGLSGTGKTTLSSDVNRILIGDDEHSWTPDGITNFEAGCYAKTIRLNKEDEPQIWLACHGKETILENVIHHDGEADFSDNSLTENCRASYPFYYIPNADSNGYINKHPKNIIMLTCDAFGVLPPVSYLDSNEAYKQFLLGYTAKVAGTETGIDEPKATFSFCFGAPFMPLSPRVYADLLKKKIEYHSVPCWLVNTGWIGGPYGIGNRIPIKVTRKIINKILDGSMASYKRVKHDYTGMTIPLCENIDETILFPEKGWKNIEEYKNKADYLNRLFIEREKSLPR